VTLHHVRQEALAAWPAIRGVLAGWLKSRSLSHQVAAVDRLLKAMTLGMAWQPAQQQRFMLVIQLAEPHGGTLTLPVGQEALPAEAERGQGAVIHHGRRDAIPPRVGSRRIAHQKPHVRFLKGKGHLTEGDP
jgi:hypothetical protein